MSEMSTPRPYDEAFIEGQVIEMLSKRWTALQIAGWFARWGYEEGKALMMPFVAAKDERIAFLERALDQAIEYGGHEVTELLKYKNDVKDHPDLAAYLREKEPA